MGTSLSTILEPAKQLIDLLFMPKIVYFCAFFAYEGFRNGVTLTHIGMRKGVIAKIYAAFYLLVALGNLWLFPAAIKRFLTHSPADIREALFFATSIPALGFTFIGLAVLIFFFTEGLIRYAQSKQSRRSRKAHQMQSTRRFISWFAALPFALGIQALFGLPEWVEVSIFVFFMYFAPFTSPQELKRVAKMPVEKSQNAKSSIQPENVG